MSDDLFGGGFAEVRDGEQITPVIRPTAVTAAAETDAEEPTGVIVVALPANDDPVQDIGTEDKHATLLDFGDLPGGDRENPRVEEYLPMIQEACATVAAQLDSLTADVTGVDSLGDGGARVWLLADDPLASVRSDVLDVDTELTGVMEEVEQFPTYTPHVTIGYAEETLDGDGVNPELTLDEETEQAAADVASIRFDRLAVWAGGVQTEYPLGQETPVTEPITAAAGDPAPTVQALDAGEPAPGLMPGDDLGDRFYGVAVVENSQTGDRRVFAPGSIRWDENLLPMPFGWQVQDAPGHDGSVVCGRIDTFERFGNLIGYTGTWDLDGAGWEVRRLAEGRYLTGLSVDTDDCDVQIVTEDGIVLDGFDAMFSDEEPLLYVKDSRIRSAVACRVPAFAEAFIANGEPPAGWSGERPAQAVEEPVEEEAALPALVAAAVKAGNPAAGHRPRASLFSRPALLDKFPEGCRLTATELSDGSGWHVYGHLATWGTCHIGFDGYCVDPEPSPSNYAYFAVGCVETDDGKLTAVGQLTMDTGHADLSLGARPAAAHYDNTGAAVADVAMGQDGTGIWFSGVTRPGVTREQVYRMRAAGKVSGDWRVVGGVLELVAALVVNVPGYPIPRTALAASGGRTTALVAAGMVGDTRLDRDPLDPAVIAQITAQVEDRLTRRDRALGAHATLARIRRSRATARLSRAIPSRER